MGYYAGVRTHNHCSAIISHGKRVCCTIGHIYLRHILEVAERIGRYLVGVGWERFGGAELLQDGVIRQLGGYGRGDAAFAAGIKEQVKGILRDYGVDLRGERWCCGVEVEVVGVRETMEGEEVSSRFVLGRV